MSHISVEILRHFDIGRYCVWLYVYMCPSYIIWLTFVDPSSSSSSLLWLSILFSLIPIIFASENEIFASELMPLHCWTRMPPQHGTIPIISSAIRRNNSNSYEQNNKYINNNGCSGMFWCWIVLDAKRFSISFGFWSVILALGAVVVYNKWRNCTSSKWPDAGNNGNIGRKTIENIVQTQTVCCFSFSAFDLIVHIAYVNHNVYDNLCVRT